MSLKSCMFTNTPDGHFIIDRHPGYPQVSFTSPCSGHGFKFVSVLGEVMADLAERGETRHNIELFRMERFAGQARRLPRLGDRTGAGHTQHTPYRAARTGLDRSDQRDGRWQQHSSVVAEEAADTIRPFW
jgi:hypothetical protein